MPGQPERRDYDSVLRDLEKRVQRLESSISVGTLVVPTLSSGWAPYALGFNYPPRYWRSFGRVWLNGVVAGPSTGTIYTLDDGYCPSHDLVLPPMWGGAGVCRVDVHADGNIILVSGDPTAWLSFNGISFPLV